MKLALLHLSDIHFQLQNNPVATRGDAIAAAFCAAAPGVKACLIVVSGDIAYSGQSGEYAVAKQFFNGLDAELKRRIPDLEVSWTFVPGNHDCNFKSESKVRPYLLRDIQEIISKPALEDEIAETCLSVQKEFFTFEEEFACVPARSVVERLHRRQEVSLNGTTIRFECFNTAWLSRLKEKAGDLYFPASLLPADFKAEGADIPALVVSVLHHPYGWLEPNNRHDVQTAIEKSSDVVLSGHEHLQNYFQLKRLSSEQVQYIEGAVLQETGGQQSGFNVLQVDWERQEQQLFGYQWKSGKYSQVVSTAPMPFVRNKYRTLHEFENTRDFSAWLSDPGRGFKHPAKRDLQLSDVFLYPNLKQRSFKSQLAASRGKSTVLFSDKVLSYAAQVNKVLITGENESGKTALCKSLYVDLKRQHQLLPILLSGDEIEAPSEEALASAAWKAFKRQYRASELERYQQLESSRRVLVIDDFQKFKYNARGQQVVLRAAELLFGRVIVIADDLFRYEELMSRGEANPFADYDHCDIQPFFYQLRRRLISKWISLGREYTADEKTLQYEINVKEEVIDTLIGKNLMPPFPITILVILQTAEAGQNHTLFGGSYGHTYEALITQAITGTSDQLSDTTTKDTYLSRLAYLLFNNDIEVVTIEQLKEFTEEHLKGLRLGLETWQLLEELLQSEILEERNGMVAFRYRYYYYYFVAKQLKNDVLIQSEQGRVRRQLRELADYIYYEPYANILVFYLYFNLDIDLIGYVLEKAEFIFREHEPCNLDSHVEFFNRLDPATPVKVLPESRPTENREQMLADMDVDEHAEAKHFEKKPEKITYSDELDLVAKMNIAFKVQQVLGQVLRNFPGSIGGDLKARIASECYLLGLRALQAILVDAEAAYDSLKEYIEHLVRERRQLDRQAGEQPPIPKNADQFLLWLAEACSFGIIKRTSRAVGHEQLGPTYADVLKQGKEETAFRLIDLSIKLDYLSQDAPPELEIRHLKKQLHDNPFGFKLLQQLVFHHLCIFWVDYTLKQRLAALVGIELQGSKMLDARTKLIG